MRNVTEVPSRPIAKWHGGKWMIAPWIIRYIPDHRVYIEPFAGVASVLMRKRRSHVEVLNDAYGRIVNAFRVIRDQGQDLARLLRFTPCSEEEYRSCRECSEDPLEDARRMIVLGHQSHGSTGAISGGKKSGWRRGMRPNGPASSAEWKELWRQVEAWADRLRGVYIEHGDALDLICRWDGPDVVFYVDPPYLQATRSHSSGKVAYGDYELDESGHVRLAEVLKGCSGAVLLSGYRSGLYDQLYPGWRRVERQACADRGAPRTECLWMNQKAAVATAPLFEGVSA